ncbi:Alpha/Beta hydrolase protein [Phakopsora pachyrhizi]|nr:Alpha/Beta hydrolase protein [Phakopsora pachyrhizi]
MSKPSLQGQAVDVELKVQSPIPIVTDDCAKDSKKKSCSGSERPVSFFIPDSVRDKRNTPLLIAFHGSTENGSIFRTRTTGYGYDQLACEFGFIVAYPSGYKGNWNDSRKAVSYPAKVENVDDIEFTKLIIEYASTNWHTSPQKTLIAGYSNGGHLCYRLILELGSEYIAGAAIHCANLPTDDNSDCKPIPLDSVPVVIFNGTADPVNPWSGGEVSLSHSAAPSGSVGSRGSHRTRFLQTGHDLEMEEIEDLDEIQDVRQFRDPVNGHVLVKLVAMIGEGHYVPVAAGEKKALVIGPRRGAIHAPREVSHEADKSDITPNISATNFFFSNIPELKSEVLTKSRASLETVFSKLSIESV